MGNWAVLSKAESKITIILHRIIIVDMSLISSILGDLGDAPHRYRHIHTHTVNVHRSEKTAQYP